MNSFKDKLINIDNSKYKRNTINNIEINKSYKASKIINNYKLEQKKNSTKNIDKNNNKKINQIINFISKERRYIYFCDDELNNLNYEDALSIDFRSFIQFYLSLLKQNNLFIFTFIVKNDYNIFLLKISLFFITFALFYFMNTIFFVDDSIHKIYEEQGKYNFIYQIPQTIYSTIITQIFSFLLENLALSQDVFLDIKIKKNLLLVQEEINKVSKKVKKKCFLFFIIGVFLLFVFWYYISAFNAVYYNTQIQLIKDSIISFLTSLLYPFLFILFPGIFRIISLRYKIKGMYIFSKFIIKFIEIC